MARALVALLFVASPLPHTQAFAQGHEAEATAPAVHEEPVYLALDVSAGAMATDDQRGFFRLDRPGGEGRLTVGVQPLDWLGGELTAGLLGVGTAAGNPGLVLDVNLGLRAMPRFGSIAPFLAVSAGIGMTGKLLVPTFHAQLGVLFDVTPEWSLGPELGVIHVAWQDGELQSSDAVFPSVGVNVRYRFHTTTTPPLPPPEPAPEPALAVPMETFFEPLPPAPPVDNDALFALVDRAVPATQTRNTQELVSPLLFEHDTTELSRCGEASLYDVLEAIDRAPASARIFIEGHADGTGDPDYNRALSLRRAEEVRRFLIEHHIDAARLEVRAVGETVPLVEEVAPGALSLNRRVLVRIETLSSIVITPSDAPVNEEVTP